MLLVVSLRVDGGYGCGRGGGGGSRQLDVRRRLVGEGGGSNGLFLKC
jgi:hypothetical protein